MASRFRVVPRPAAPGELDALLNKPANIEPFKSRSDLDARSLDEIRATFDAYSSPPMFTGRICGLSPAFLLWAINAVCFLIHLGMGIAVAIQGGKAGSLLSIQTKTLVGIWRNRTAEAYDLEVADAALTLRLDYLCFGFAFISAFAHFVICCFSLYAFNEWHARINLKFYYWGIYSCLTWWCVRVCILTPTPQCVCAQ